MAAESYDSLSTMALASDAIVVGRIGAVDPGREWKANEDEWLEPEPSDALLVRFATLTIEVEEVIGTLTADASVGSIQLEVFLPRNSALEELRATAPGERAVFFLRTKADAPEFFRLVNDNQGLVREFDGKSHVVGATEGNFLGEIDGLPFEDFVAELRTIVP